MSKVAQDPKKVALSKYADGIRKKAANVNDDKYLLAMADRIEQGGNTLAGSIDLAIQTRLEVLDILNRETEIASAKVADTVVNTDEIKKLQEAVFQMNERLTLLYTTFVTIGDALAWNIGISGDMLDKMNATRKQMVAQAEQEQTPVPDIKETDVGPLNPDATEDFNPEGDQSTEPPENDDETLQETLEESLADDTPEGVEEFKPE